MAILILQQPYSIAPVHNPLIYVVSSDNSAQPNFRFVAVVKDGSGNIIAKRRFPLVPNTTNGWIDISKILAPLLTYDFAIGQIDHEDATNTWTSYSVEFGEYYGSTPVDYLNLTATGAKRIWTASLRSLDEFPGWLLSQYEIKSGTLEGRWFSSFDNKRVKLDQIDFIGYLATQATAPDEIEVVATLDDNTTLTSRVAVTAGAGLRVYNFPSGPSNLNDIIVLSTGTPGDVIPLNTISYTIRARRAGVTFGPTMRYEIYDNCTNFVAHDVFFLNRFGIVESFRFDGLTDVDYTITDQSYTSPIVRYDSGAVGYAANSGAKKRYYVEAELVKTLRSWWLTDDESSSFLDLMTSPVVFDYSEGQLREVIISPTSHRKKTSKSGQLQQIELQCRYASNEIRQTR